MYECIICPKCGNMKFLHESTHGFIHVTGRCGYRIWELEARKIVFILQSNYCCGSSILYLMNSDVLVGYLRNILRSLCRKKMELDIDRVRIETVRSFCEKTLNASPQIYPYPYLILASPDVRCLLLNLIRKQEMQDESGINRWQTLDMGIARWKEDGSYLKHLAGIEQGTIYFGYASDLDLPGHYRDIFNIYLASHKEFGIYDQEQKIIKQLLKQLMDK